MRKKIGFLLLIIILLTGCSFSKTTTFNPGQSSKTASKTVSSTKSDLDEVLSIEVIDSSIPDELVIDEFDLRDIIDNIEVLIKYKGGKEERIKLNYGMFPEAEIEKFIEVGTHNISFTYKGYLVDFTINIIERIDTNRHSVKFIGFDKEVIETLYYDNETNIERFPMAPSIDGYDFVGYSLTLEEINDIKKDYVVVLMYEEIKEKTVTISFLGHEKVVLSEQTYSLSNIGDLYYVDAPSVEGYYFLRWDKEYDEVIKMTEDVSVNAIYNIIPESITPHNVKFVDEEGNTILEGTMNDENKIDSFEGFPVPEGYILYEMSHTMDVINYIEEDITVVVSYREIADYVPVEEFSYKIEFYDMDELVETIYYTHETKHIELPAVRSIVGYAFVSWDKSVDDIWNTKEDLKVYSIRKETDEAIKHKVTFLGYEDEIIDEVIFDPSSEVPFDAPEPSKINMPFEHKFTGWDHSIDEMILSKVDIVVRANIEKMRFQTITVYGFNDCILNIPERLELGYFRYLPEPIEIYGYEFVGYDMSIEDIKKTEGKIDVHAIYNKVDKDLKEYKVTLLDKNGKPWKTAILIDYLYRNGMNYHLPKGPNVEGYRFYDWDMRPFAYDNEHAELIPVYIKLGHYVTFHDINGDIISEPIRVDEGAPIMRFPDGPSIPGKYFVRWNMSYYEMKTAGRNVSVYPIYDDIKDDAHIYKITYIAEYDPNLHDSYSKIVDVVYTYVGNRFKEPTAPKISGYDFLNWHISYDTLMMVGTDTETDGVYKRNKAKEYIVRFMNNDGSILKEVNVTEGSSITEYPTPADIPNYEFKYWMDSYQLDNITKDLDIYPYYELIEYKKAITFFGFPDEDSNIENLGTFYYKTLDDIKYPEVVAPEGYEFIGWSVSLEEVKTLEEYYSYVDVIYLKKCEDEGIYHKVIYYGLYDSVLNAIYVADNERINHHQTPRYYNGYEFISWDTDFFQAVIEDRHIYPIYEKDVRGYPFTITFKAMNEEIISTITITSEEDDFEFPIPIEYKDFKFDGWSQTKEYILSYKKDITIYANYSVYKVVVPHKVTIVNELGVVLYESTITEPLSDDFYNSIESPEGYYISGYTRDIYELSYSEEDIMGMVFFSLKE